MVASRGLPFIWLVTVSVLSIVAAATGVAHASPYSTINAAAAADPIRITKLRGGVSMLSGSGGNIGVLSGPQGIFLVDAGISVSKAKIQAALRTINRGPVRYVVNTHWHWDHTDGNAWLRSSGASIIADRRASLRLSQTLRIVEWEHTFTPISPKYLPTLLLSGDRTMPFAGETLELRHYRPGHTDGDISVFFKRANILQTGDTFWNGMYPFIDYVGGGSINGAIRAAEANIAAVGASTVVIPGHGPVGDRAALIAFRDMLVSARDRVAALKRRGLTIDEVVARRPTASLDSRWGRALISGELFTRLIYRGV